MRSEETLKMLIRVCARLCLLAVCLLGFGTAHAQNTGWTFNPPALFPTNEWGPVTNDCQLGLRFPKLQYQAGEQILAAIILRNVGDKQLKNMLGDPHKNYEVIATEGDGRSVLYTESWTSIINRPNVGAIGGSAHNEQLPPHQQQYPHWVDVTERYAINQPGEYTVLVKEHTGIVSKQVHETNSVATLDIFSNPVTITVVAPSPTKPEK